MSVQQKDITALTKARETVRAIQQRLSSANGFGEGRVMQACEEADHAIFQVLILLDVYGIQDVEDQDLFPLGQVERKSTSTNGDGKEPE